MRKIQWEVSEHDIADYAKEILEVELSDWQLLHVMDQIELKLEKLVNSTIEETMELDE